MNVGRLVTADDNGIDPNWFIPDASLAGECEEWLYGMNYYAPGIRALNVARRIVKDSRSRG